MRGAFPGLCLALLAAERGARLCAIVHYLVHGQLGWFGLSVACVVPGYAAQLLSILWFRADGRPPDRWLLALHLLQLGLWKRYWDVLRMAAEKGPSARAGEVLTQHGDVCALRLLEAVLQTLPHLLLQAYVVVAVDPAGFVPGVSAGLSLLSFAWALVSYSCFSCLMKPGHLFPPAAAILCLLLWRTGMLGTRVLALVLFARLYSFWVFAVAGIHWLLMAFWLVAQQTDIVAQPCRWRLFNCLVGAVYIFCYVNVRPGPSKNRMAAFYAIMLMENTLLLLLATRFPQAELRNSLCMTAAIMSGSVIGAAALVVYYSLLHPKSTEIWQGFVETTCSAAAAGDDEDAGDCSQAGQSLGILGDGESSSGERTTADPKNENSSSLLQFRGCLEDSWTNHHHWLLVKLALKTGDMSKINAAFGDGGAGEVYPGGWVMGKPGSVVPGPNLSLPAREIGPPGVESGLTDEKLQAAGNGGDSKPSAGAAGMAREDGAGQEPGFRPAVSFPSSFSQDPAEGSSVYFSASTGGITSPGLGTATSTCMALVQRDGEAQPSPGCQGGGGGGDLSLEMASISPILGACAHKHLQSSSSLGGVSGCGVAGPPKKGPEPLGPEGGFMGWHRLWDTQPCGTQGTVVRSKLRPPCFTSTPKADPRCPQQGLGELGEGTDLPGLLE
ncbi:XK-related protein 5 isoform X2 [Aquila chrysaetos chrysaetos]|uniref:XK-related protein 5 isoform X2 n=1 Tax=Aquila chrysaetos chrysaetos TaxID=223781 RepID=UPI001176F9A8|nr:XK-related protein 5 isoform X2 [Aquila chrysaetos chrysaetos]